MIKAVLFDFDDTLVKTKVIRYEALKEAGKIFYKLSLTDSDIDKHWGKPLYSMISAIYNKLDTQEKLYENYKSILGKYPFGRIEHTNEVIMELSKKYLLAIISSNNSELLMSGFSDVKLDPKYFNFIQSSDDTNSHKPNPEVFTPALEKLRKKGIDKLNIIYVGDAFDDYHAAVNAGFHFCGVANRTIDASKFKSENIPYIVDIRDLPDFIEEINNIKSA